MVSKGNRKDRQGRRRAEIWNEIDEITLVTPIQLRIGSGVCTRVVECLANATEGSNMASGDNLKRYLNGRRSKIAEVATFSSDKVA